MKDLKGCSLCETGTSRIFYLITEILLDIREKLTQLTTT